jgi:ribosomal-protein-alanine N-acetyltransferase
MDGIRVGVAQIPQTNDIETNHDKIIEYLHLSGSKDVDILCFPEAQTQGYRVDIVEHDAPVLNSRLEEIHREVATVCGDLNMACILGTELPNPGGGKLFNAALVIDEHGVIVGSHSKNILTPLDAKAYTPGKGFEVFKLKDISCGFVICFEGFRFPWTTRTCVSKGAQIIFHPQNNTTRPGMEWKIPVHESMAITRAAENTVFFVSANISHKYNNCRSLIIAPNGQILNSSTLKKEQLIYSDIDLSQATRAMFLFEKDGISDVIFGNSVTKRELGSINEKEMKSD